MLTPAAMHQSVTLILLPLCLISAESAVSDETHCPVGCICYPWLPRMRPVKIEANCSRLSLKTLPPHFQRHIASLDASFNDIEKISNDFFGESKMKLSKVNLSNNSISTIEERAFTVLPDLWMLNLTGNRIEYLHHDTFKYNSKLWYLILRGNIIDVFGHSVFLNAPQIGKLDLSYNNIRELKDSTFSQMPNIVYLRLHDNQFRKLQSTWFRPLSRLERLFLEKNRLTHLDVDTFVHMPKLFELSLGRNKLIVPSDSPFLRLPNLEYLHLTDCDLGSLPSRMFELAPRVRMLWLSSNRLRSLSVGMFHYLESLVFLDACDNRLQCTCDLREVWQMCRYRHITADVSCTYGEGEEEGGAEACAGRWDVLSELACNASARAAPAEQEGTSVARLAGYAGAGAVLLLALAAAGLLLFWKCRSRRTRGGAPARGPPFPDMMPLKDDERDDAP